MARTAELSIRIVEVCILSGERAGERLSLSQPERVRLGSAASSDVRLAGRQVAPEHAELRLVGSGYHLSNLSQAGTFVGEPPSPVGPEGRAMEAVSEVMLGSGGPRLLFHIGWAVPFGRYRLTGHLGGGGMAEVFMAQQLGLGGFERRVAIKLIQPGLYGAVDVESMLLDEARIAAGIHHPHVVQIHDVGEQDGVLFVAMEYLSGISLASLIRQLNARGERMLPELAAALLAQACGGLHAAHTLRDSAGQPLHVVHRDVSPGNLMLSPEGMVKVIDFGVARAEQRLHRSLPGIVGKPAYMAPEQIRQEAVDRRADLFAMGAVFYELCTGEPLFLRDTMEATLVAAAETTVPPLQPRCPDATPRMERLLGRALARDRDQRFPDAEALAGELLAIVEDAGGRFASPTAIARYFDQRGYQLRGAPPTPLLQVPAALAPAAKRSGSSSLPTKRSGPLDVTLPAASSAEQVPVAPLQRRRTLPFAAAVGLLSVCTLGVAWWRQGGCSPPKPSFGDLAVAELPPPDLSAVIPEAVIPDLSDLAGSIDRERADAASVKLDMSSPLSAPVAAPPLKGPLAASPRPAREPGSFVLDARPAGLTSRQLTLIHDCVRIYLSLPPTYHFIVYVDRGQFTVDFLDSKTEPSGYNSFELCLTSRFRGQTLPNTFEVTRRPIPGR